jgi:two-component system sensor histidine kinase ResE
VRDSGTGIAPEELPFIFERFYRVDKARMRSAAGLGVGSGAGLGLSIVQALVGKNGGTIRVESIVGQGTVFEIDFPLGENA